MLGWFKKKFKKQEPVAPEEDTPLAEPEQEDIAAPVKDNVAAPQETELDAKIPEESITPPELTQVIEEAVEDEPPVTPKPEAEIEPEVEPEDRNRSRKQNS